MRHGLKQSKNLLKDWCQWWCKMAEDVLSCKLPFHNLVANILFNNQLHEEDIAIKNIWKKGSNRYFNVYFYNSRQTRILDANYFHDIYDLDSGRYYKDMEVFSLDFLSVEREHKERSREETKSEKIENSFRYLESLRAEVTILAFFARLNNSLQNIKNNVVSDFIRRRQPKSVVMSEQYVDAYVKSMTPTKDDFYEALHNLKHKDVKEVEDLACEAVKISITDGTVHYDEKIYLAELFQTLRDYGIEPDIEF